MASRPTNCSCSSVTTIMMLRKGKNTVIRLNIIEVVMIE